MTKISANFRFFLAFFLFLVYVPPSAQMPGRPFTLSIFRRNQLAKYKMSLTKDETGRHNTGKEKTMHTRRGKPPRLLEEDLEDGTDYGSYFVGFGIGTPPQQFYTDLNTESSLTWIQCKPCVNCYSQKDPKFDPVLSKSSYKPLGCDSKPCQELNVSGSTSCSGSGNTCRYTNDYIDKSVTKGDFVTETLSIGDMNFSEIAIGCGHDNTGLFYDEASGIFALNRGPLSFLSQAQYSTFSYCVAHKDSPKESLLQFGSSATFSEPLFTTQMFTNSRDKYSYYVGLTEICVNNHVVAIPQIDPSNGNGGTIVGFGTAVSRFPQEVYNQLRDVFVKEARGLTAVGKYDLFDTCYNLTSQSADFPTLTFHFGPDRLTLRPENVMSLEGNYNCFGFAPTSSSFSTIGNYQQQGIGISFDIQEYMFSFFPDRC